MGFRIEVDAMCIIMMLWIYRRIHRDKDEKRAQGPFLLLISCLVATSFFDIVCTVIERQLGPGWSLFNNIFTCAFLISMVGSCYMWFVYSTTFTKNKKLMRKENRWGYRVPVLIMLLLIVISPWTGIIFNVNPESNHALMGYLGFLVYIIPSIYILMAALQLIIAFVLDPETKTVLTVETIILFIVLPPASLFSNLFIDSVSSTIPAFSLILTAVCFDTQIGHISTDGLTGLNNKRQYLQFITNCLNEPQSALTVYLFMIDLDYFKYINDEYGHSEGDKALIEVSELLKKLCSGSQGMFLARYGGDEFVFVIKSRFEEEITNLKRDILKAIKERNEKPSNTYKLSVSIGYASFEYGKDSLETLTARADEMLYQEKERHHIEIDRERMKEKAN